MKEFRRRMEQSFERQYGSFQRSITLPPYADTDNPQTSYEQGVLEIKFPKKKEKPEKKQIRII